jgi:HEPN domain-containing protein
MSTTNIQQLSKPQLAILVQLIQKIVETVTPLKIICYGYRTTKMSDWSCFFDSETNVRTMYPTFDLLLITNDSEKRPNHEIIEIVEKHAAALGCDATTIVEHQKAVNKGLENGKRFVSTVFRYGAILYNNDTDVTIPAKELDSTVLNKLIEDNWQRYFGLAHRFFKTANYCFENGWYEQTIIDLHHSVEHACIAILKVCTGYRPTTRNLSRLLDLTCNFSQELMVVFPRLTKEETFLFNTLNRAYSDARYNEKFIVSTEVAKIIMERVATLIGLVEKLYEKKRLCIEAVQPVSFPLNVDSQ